MASNGLGAIAISLGLDAADFVNGLTRSERDAQRAAKAIEKSFKDTGNVLKGVFAGIGIAATFRKFTTESVNAQNEAAQLAAVLKSTGEAAGFGQQKLNAMAVAMSQNSIFREGDITKAQTRLLSYTGVVGEQVPQAMQAAIDMASRLGMDLSQSAELVGKALDVPSQGMTALSKQGFRFTEDQKKLVEALEKTGRTGEAQAIILDSMKSAYDGAGKAARDTFGGAIAALQNQLNDLMAGGDGSLDGTTEAVNALTGVLGSPETKQAFASFTTGLSVLITWTVKAASEILTFTTFVGKAVAQMNIDSEKLTFGDKIKDMALSVMKYGPVIGLFHNSLKKFEAGANNVTVDDPIFPAIETTKGGKPKPKKPVVFGDGDATKKLLDNALKELERQAAQEKDILASRNKFLDMYNTENLLSFQDYYAGRRVALDENVRDTLALYDLEIAALEKHKAAAKKATEREDAQGKINELLEKKAKLQRDAGEQGIVLAHDEAKAFDDLNKQIRSTYASLLELQGNTAGATMIRLNDQFADQVARFTAEGNTQALAFIDSLKAAQVAQAEFNQAAEAGRAIQERLRLEEERAAISRSTGAITELDYLKQVSDARQRAAAELAGISDSLDAIAQGSGLKPLILQADQARVQMEKLNAESDLVAEKYNTIFKDSFADSFADFITSTKSAGDAFKAFANSVISQLARIAAQEAATALFGGKKSEGGGFLSSIFGALFSGFGGGVGMSTNSVGSLGSLGLSGGRASGGPVSAGGLYRVNERGPELLDVNGQQFLMMGSKGGKVTANDKIGGSGSMKLTIVNNTTGRIDNVQERQISPTERALIISEAVQATSAQFSDPNSKMSKTFGRNYASQRVR